MSNNKKFDDLNVDRLEIFNLLQRDSKLQCRCSIREGEVRESSGLDSKTNFIIIILIDLING